MSDDRRATAHHEAGHFVASYVLTPRLYRGDLTIEPDPAAGYLGQCLHEGWHDEDTARSEVVIAYAGFAAEKRFDPNADPGHSWQDDEDAAEILAFLGEGEADARVRAEDFVARHWGAVTALAGELLRHGTLDETEAEVIVDIAQGQDVPGSLANYRALRRQSAARAQGAGGVSMMAAEIVP